MKKLSDAVKEAGRGHDNNGQGLLDLQQAGIDWVGYCMKELEGNLFDKGLKIGIAIKEFSDELANKEDRDMNL